MAGLETRDILLRRTDSLFVANGAVFRESLPVVIERPLGVAQVRVGHAHVVQGTGFPLSVSNLSQDWKSFFERLQCLSSISELVVEPTDIVERLGFG